MVNVKLSNGNIKEVENGTTVYELVKSLGGGLYKTACVCRIDGEVKDLRYELQNDCELEVLTFEHPDGKRCFGTQPPIFWLRQ